MRGMLSSDEGGTGGEGVVMGVVMGGGMGGGMSSGGRRVGRVLELR